MLTEFFWVAWSVFLFGIIVLLIDLWFGVDSRISVWWRVCLTSGLIAAFSVFCFITVFAYVPLEIAAIENNGQHPDGTVISGINWRPEFSELDIRLTNPTTRGYDDLDVLLRADSPIAAIAQQSDLPSVSFEVNNNVRVTAMLKEANSTNTKVIPLVLVASDGGYRIRCPRVPPEAVLDIVLAIAEIKWNPQPATDSKNNAGVFDPDYVLRFKYDDFSSYWFGYPTGNIYAPRPKVNWLKVHGTYKAAMVPRTIDEKIDVVSPMDSALRALQSK